MRSPTPADVTLHPHRARGFTLIELMVVVLIITILAVIAIPGIVTRMDNYRAKEAADNIATLYRNARLRAMGRGSSVLVRFENGNFTVLEGIIGTANANAACQPLPVPSCTEPANRFTSGSGLHQVLSGMSLASSDLQVDIATYENDTPSYLDVCFTPLGRSYWRQATNDALEQMTGVQRATLTKSVGSGTLRRDILILPNGHARVAAR